VNALELRGISAGYGRTTVLRDVDLEVPGGSVVALLGPNGAGKTTLLRVAAGLLRAAAGKVSVQGADVGRRPPHARVRAGLCLIPSAGGVFADLSVRQNLRLQVPSWRKGAGIDPAIEAFPFLAARLGQRAGTLSGGEQQMLALARCYLAAPAVVLLDEVSMGLAPRVIDRIFGSLAQLAASGVSLLLVEQYVSRALGAADTVYLLERGSVTFSGKPSDLNEDAALHGYYGTSRGGPSRVRAADTNKEDR
jgi:branched-chain amino acid transport system ATP-binding protein